MGEKVIDLSFNITTPKELARDKDRGCTPRLKRLRKISHETQPHLDLERALIETEVYKQYEGKVSTPVLRALVLKEYFSKKELYFGEAACRREGADPAVVPDLPGDYLPLTRRHENHE